MIETIGTASAYAEPVTPEWRRLSKLRVGRLLFWRCVSLDVMEKAADGWTYVEVRKDFWNGPTHETQKHDERVFRLCVGGDSILLREPELKDVSDVFYKLMSKATWSLRDGRITVDGGSLGNRTLSVPPWAVHALGTILTPYFLKEGAARGAYR